MVRRARASQSGTLLWRDAVQSHAAATAKNARTMSVLTNTVKKVVELCSKETIVDVIVHWCTNEGVSFSLPQPKRSNGDDLFAFHVCALNSTLMQTGFFHASPCSS